eukprot:CAMPEP_0202707422 /NCGR_PEP_ID=MMETSP1385-20130828/19756_1 /ASSEMBLY_ACC=CAM_ASM_000861 /TAXON_ID=933848 /ORGANISM="Elphidium margaritaceum" /LENGTH=255 /DNA_ID=CAMNT_0049366139 /DNA_START=108 /DNA_END=876 /DNA_ORIENTATION=-
MNTTNSNSTNSSSLTSCSEPIQAFNYNHRMARSPHNPSTTTAARTSAYKAPFSSQPRRPPGSQPANMLSSAFGGIFGAEGGGGAQALVPLSPLQSTQATQMQSQSIHGALSQNDLLAQQLSSQSVAVGPGPQQPFSRAASDAASGSECVIKQEDLDHIHGNTDRETRRNNYSNSSRDDNRERDYYEIMIRGDCVAVKREEVIVTAEAIVVSLDRDRVAHRQEATVKKEEAIVAIIVGLDRDHTAHRQETTVAIDE